MKKLLSLVLAVLLLVTSAVVVNAAKIEKESVGTSGKVYFEKPSWAGTIFYTHIFEAKGDQTSFFGWQSRKEKLTEEGGKLAYDLSILDDSSAQLSGGLKAGTDYTIMLSDNLGNESCGLMFNTKCIGDTFKIVSSEKTFENAVDSTKHSYEASWTKNANKYGIPLMITSVGTVQGRFIDKGKTIDELIRQWDKDYPDYPSSASYSPQSSARDHKTRLAELKTQLLKMSNNNKILYVGGGYYRGATKSVKLNYTKKSIGLKKSFKIKATTTNNCQISWTTSNKKIASLSKKTSDSGKYIKVTGKKAGKATITAKAKDGSKKYKKCVVTVYKNTKAKDISLSKYYASVVVGNNFKVKATLKPGNIPNKTIKWSTNDFVVAYLSKTKSKSGQYITIRTHGIGKAKVKAMATDGSKLSAVLSVNVHF